MTLANQVFEILMSGTKIRKIHIFVCTFLVNEWTSYSFVFFWCIISLFFQDFVQKIIRKRLKNNKKRLKITNPCNGLQMAPLAIKRCRDITTDIPDMFPASDAPTPATAPPVTRFYDCSSCSHSSRELTDIPPWVLCR